MKLSRFEVGLLIVELYTNIMTNLFVVYSDSHRYIPLNRLNESIRTRENLEPGCSFSSLSTGKGVERANSSLTQCKLGSTEAVVKVLFFTFCSLYLFHH